MPRATITAVAHWTPDKILSNADLEKIVDTTDEWIRDRTGIRERRILENGATSDLAAHATRRLLERRGMEPNDIELLIVATVTPDMMFPPTACILQEKIGAKNAWGFDLSAACSGFLYALVTGAQFVASGTYRRVVVVGADKMTAITDYEDRNTCILFGDAGAAVLLEPSPDDAFGILDHRLYADGAGEPFLHQKGGGSLMPASHESVEQRAHFVYQDGRAVFKVAVQGMANCSVEIMQRNHLTANDIDWLVPHQANLRIIDACGKRMGLDPAKVMINIDRYGNTTAATIPMCLSEYWADGRLRRGQRLVLSAFGAGYTWGSVLVRWSVPDANLSK